MTRSLRGHPSNNSPFPNEDGRGSFMRDTSAVRPERQKTSLLERGFRGPLPSSPGMPQRGRVLVTGLRDDADIVGSLDGRAVKQFAGECRHG